MPDAAALPFYFAYGQPAVVYGQPADIVGLTAAARVEGCAVKRNAQLSILFIDSSDGSVKFLDVGVVVKEFGSHQFLASVLGKKAYHQITKEKARPQIRDGLKSPRYHPASRPSGRTALVPADESPSCLAVKITVHDTGDAY
jgi:hypothetical protein